MRLHARRHLSPSAFRGEVHHQGHLVILTRKKDDKPESAVMTFAPDYQSFEVLDFDKKRRITGKRVP